MQGWGIYLTVCTSGNLNCHLNISATRLGEYGSNSSLATTTVISFGYFATSGWVGILTQMVTTYGTLVRSASPLDDVFRGRRRRRQDWRDAPPLPTVDIHADLEIFDEDSFEHIFSPGCRYHPSTMLSGHARRILGMGSRVDLYIDRSGCCYYDADRRYYADWALYSRAVTAKEVGGTRSHAGREAHFLGTCWTMSGPRQKISEATIVVSNEPHRLLQERVFVNSIAYAGAVSAALTAASIFIPGANLWVGC